MTLYNNLLFYGKYYGVDNSHIDELLKKVGLYGSRKHKVLFLDESTSGIDPSTSRAIHELILELKEEGTTIFLTTHDMNEATLLYDSLALLNEGRLVETGSPSNLLQKYNQDKPVKLTYQDKSEEILPFDELARVMEEVIAIHSCEPSLEDIFIELTGGKLNV